MEVYSDRFFNRERAGALRSARVIVPLILDLVQPRSVVDVGCGRGTWLSVVRERGIDDVLGVDGPYINRLNLEIPDSQFLSRDLQKTFRLNRQFDLVMSLEVAEHLPKESAEGFVETLVNLGPVVAFSAAVPWQGGERHVNEQWPDYWAALFQSHGYVTIDCVRRRVWKHVDVEGWYAQNTLVFVDRNQLGDRPALAKEYQLTNPAQLCLVHPKMYLQMVEWALEEADQA